VWCWNECNRGFVGEGYLFRRWIILFAVGEGLQVAGASNPLHIPGFFFNKRKDIDYNKKKERK